MTLDQKRPGPDMVPLSSLSAMFLPEVMDAIADYFDHEFYRTRYPDIASADLDPLKHYCSHGWKEGRDPSPDFSTNAYLDRYPELAARSICPLLHRALGLNKRPAHGTVAHQMSTSDGSEVALRLVAPKAADLAAVRPHFSEDYYLDQYPDVAESQLDPLVHYMTMGWLEGRDPSDKFSTAYYLHANKDIRRGGANPFLHYCRSGIKEAWRASSAVSPQAARALMAFEEGGALFDKLEAAKDLEPMMAFPNQKAEYSSPLGHTVIANFTEEYRERFQGVTFDHVVLVPHVRMSGAAHVAGHLVHALSTKYGAENVLLVQTDASHYEFSDWFPDNVRRLDLSEALEGLPQDRKFKFLLDFIYGVEAKSIYNVQSRLFWDVLKLFGKQLCQELQITSYLFCWDMTVNGDRTGYPVQWLRDTIDFQHVLLTDSQFLADELNARYGLLNERVDLLPKSGPVVKRVWTPVELREEVAPAAKGGRARALWAGRHDRQKRVDVLVDIARANPEVDFWVYGKPVLDQKTLADYNPPSNIIEKGIYEDFGEVLENGFDFFLYTSQWDGIPTGPLAAAAARLPLIAPDVGGVSEAVIPGAGWLIEDCEDVKGYTLAIKEVLMDRDGARQRAQKLYEHLRENFSEDSYLRELEKVLK